MSMSLEDMIAAAERVRSGTQMGVRSGYGSNIPSAANLPQASRSLGSPFPAGAFGEAAAPTNGLYSMRAAGIGGSGNNIPPPPTPVQFRSGLGGPGTSLMKYVAPAEEAAASTAPSALGRLAGLAGKAGELSKGKAGLAGLGISVGGNLLAHQLGTDTNAGKGVALLSDVGGGVAAGAPFGPWGMAAGGTIGGIVGLYNMMNGGKSTKPTTIDDKFFNQFAKSGIVDPSVVEEARMYHSMLKEFNDPEADAKVANYLQVAFMDRKKNQQQLEEQMATQQLAAQFFQPYAADLMNSALTRYNQTMNLSNDLPEGYRAIAQDSASAQLSSAQRTATAYLAQAQAIPALNTAQSRQSTLDQLLQQAAAQYASGGGSSGGNSVQELTGAR